MHEVHRRTLGGERRLKLRLHVRLVVRGERARIDAVRVRAERGVDGLDRLGARGHPAQHAAELVGLRGLALDRHLLRAQDQPVQRERVGQRILGDLVGLLARGRDRRGVGQVGDVADLPAIGRDALGVRFHLRRLDGAVGRLVRAVDRAGNGRDGVILNAPVGQHVAGVLAAGQQLEHGGREHLNIEQLVHVGALLQNEVTFKKAWHCRLLFSNVLPASAGVQCVIDLSSNDASPSRVSGAALTSSAVMAVLTF